MVNLAAHAEVLKLLAEVEAVAANLQFSYTYLGLWMIFR